LTKSAALSIILSWEVSVGFVRPAGTMSIKKGYDLKDGTTKKSASKNEAEQPVYKTEETLKREARARLEEQEKLRAAIKPESERKKKYDNFLYHYKWHTIAVVAGVILLAFFLRDTLFRTSPDLTLIIATARYVSQAETDGLQAALKKYMPDLNGDGKISVQFDSIYLPLTALTGEGAQEGDAFSAAMSGADPEMIQASMMKLMAITAAWSDPLYLLDDAMYDYLAGMSGVELPESAESETEPAGAAKSRESPADPGGGALFVTLGQIPAAFGYFGDRLSIDDTLIISEPDCEMLGDLSFSLRPAPNEKQKSVEYQEYCKRLLESLAK